MLALSRLGRVEQGAFARWGKRNEVTRGTVQAPFVSLSSCNSFARQCGRCMPIIKSWGWWLLGFGEVEVMCRRSSKCRVKTHVEAFFEVA